MSVYSSLASIYARSCGYVPREEHEERMIKALGYKAILNAGSKRRDGEIRIKEGPARSYYEIRYMGSVFVTACVDGSTVIQNPTTWPSEKVSTTLNLLLNESPYRAHLKYNRSPFGGRENERIVFTKSRVPLDQSPCFTPGFPVVIGSSGEFTMDADGEVRFPLKKEPK